VKKFIIVGLLIVMGCIFTGNAFAAYCNDKGCKARINRLYTAPYGNGRVYIEFKDVNSTQANCTPVEGRYFVLYAENVAFDSINARLETSAMMGKEVWVRIVENSNTCEVIYIQTWY